MQKIILFIGNPLELRAVKEVEKYGFIAELAGADVNNNLVFHVMHQEPKRITEKFLELCNGLTPVKTAGHTPEIDFYCYKHPLLNCFYLLAGEYFQLVVCGNAGRFEQTEKFIEQNFFKM